MANILPIKGTSEEINNTPIVDGQLLFETNGLNENNFIYTDIEVESDFISGSKYYVNDTNTFVDIVPVSDQELIFNKKYDGEAYCAVIKYFVNGYGWYVTPIVFSDNETSVEFTMTAYQGGVPFASFDYIYSSTCEFNNKTWYITGEMRLSTNYISISPSDLFFDNNDSSLSISDITLLLLNEIYSDTSQNQSSNPIMIPKRINVGIYDWNGIANKPFNSIGSAFTVTNGELNLVSSVSVSWDDIIDKPFNTIGSGLYVGTFSGVKKLCADIESFTIQWRDSSSIYQQLNLMGSQGGNTMTLSNSRYIERYINLGYVEQTITVTSSDITTNSAIDILTSIPSIRPTNISISGNTCTIIFPPQDRMIDLTCRIYIK